MTGQRLGHCHWSIATEREKKLRDWAERDSFGRLVAAEERKKEPNQDSQQEEKMAELGGTRKQLSLTTWSHLFHLSLSFPASCGTGLLDSLKCRHTLFRTPDARRWLQVERFLGNSRNEKDEKNVQSLHLGGCGGCGGRPANEFSEGQDSFTCFWRWPVHQTMRLRFRQFEKEKMWQIVAKNAVKCHTEGGRSDRCPLFQTKANGAKSER